MFFPSDVASYLQQRLKNAAQERIFVFFLFDNYLRKQFKNQI